MILPIHDRLRAHLAHVLGSLYALDEAALPAIALEYPPNRELGDLGTPLAFELARRLRKAPRAIAQEIAARSARSHGIRQVAAAPTGTSISFSTGRLPPRSARPRRDCRGDPAERRQGHRRAHGDQPEQGGAHRAPAQLRARRHARARAALPRHAGGGPELHRRHRRPGGRRRGRLPRARAARRSTRSARSPTARGSTTTAGTSTRGSPSGTSRTRSACRRAPTRSTTSSTAATRTPRSPPSSPTASSAAISRRWRG